MKKIISILLCICCLAVCVSPINDNGVVSAMDYQTVHLNDTDHGSSLFCFQFFGKWNTDTGYASLFFNGDEHWTDKSQFGSNYPSVNVRFCGTQIKLYGHTCPAGGIADVSIDGNNVGNVDFYSDSRINKNLLFSSKPLTDAQHTLTLKMTGRYNEKSNGNLEAGIDYADITTGSSAESVRIDSRNVKIEEGMAYPLTATCVPDFSQPDIVWSSSDTSVATVDEKGVITGVKAGSAVITVTYRGTAVRDSISIQVAEQTSLLTGYVADDNCHYLQDNYYQYLQDSYGLDPVSSLQWNGSAWKNDISCSELVLLTKGKAVKNIRISSGDFTSDGGQVIPAGDVDIYSIKNVYAHTAGKNIPDVLCREKNADLPAQTVQPVWVNIRVPKTAAAGRYKGILKVTSDGSRDICFEYTLNVLNLVQPDPESNGVQLELWQYPYSAQRYYSGKTSAEYFGTDVTDLYSLHFNDRLESELKSQVQLYRQAGGKAITTTIVEDPWNSQTPDPYPSMVKWEKTADGTFRYDYTDFDKWVQFNFDQGINGQIKSFSMLCWGNRITYYDQASRSVKTEAPQTNSAEWKKLWTAFLKDYVRHLDEKGWFDITYMSMDERSYDEVKAAVNLIKSVRDANGKSLKISLAAYNYDAKPLFDSIDDLSLAIGLGGNGAADIAAERSQKGLKTTLYTCGAQNSAIANEPGESAYSIWYTYKCKTDGFLRWALDAFNENPLESSYNKLFAAGDIYLIYPDDKDAQNPVARSSPRFEKIAEGIRDISKLKYLRAADAALAPKIDSLVNSLDSGGNMLSEVNRMRTRLFALSDEYLQNSPSNPSGPSSGTGSSPSSGSSSGTGNSSPSDSPSSSGDVSAVLPAPENTSVPANVKPSSTASLGNGALEDSTPSPQGNNFSDGKNPDTGDGSLFSFLVTALCVSAVSCAVCALVLIHRKAASSVRKSRR